MNPSQANECSPLVLITDGVGESLSGSCPPQTLLVTWITLRCFPVGQAFSSTLYSQ